MCFYDQFRYSCGDWRWGSFVEHCNREYRKGETCGLKLVYKTCQQPEKCKYCERVDKKLHKRQIDCDRVIRWQREGRNPASIEKSMESIKQIDIEITLLYAEISSRRQATNGISVGAAETDVESESDKAMHDKHLAKLAQKIARKVPTVKQRHGLPITFEGIESPATVMSCADTGSEINAISYELASLLRLDMQEHAGDDDCPKVAEMANGKSMRSCGRITAWCALETATKADPALLLSTIYVFERLAHPFLLMGRHFLEASETLSKYTERLIKRPSAIPHIPYVRSIGTPTQWLSCSLGNKPVKVFADTGAELDLVSKNYAQQRFNICPHTTWIMFADGSTSKTCGIVKTDLTIGDSAPIYEPAIDEAEVSPLTEPEQGPVRVLDSTAPTPEARDAIRPVVDVKLHVVDDLFTDIVIGENTLNALQPFQHNPDDFIHTPQHHPAPCHLNLVVEITGPLATRLEKAKIQFRKLLPSSKAADSKLPRDVEMTAQSTSPRIDEDQRENARREAEKRDLAVLAGEERQAAEARAAQAKNSYDRLKLQRVHFRSNR